MPEVVANGIRLHVQRLDRRAVAASRRPPGVVFVHGMLGNLSVFYHTLANHVAAAGFDVLLYDLRGHGLSECPPQGYRPDTMVRDLDVLLDEEEPGRPVYLVGYSLGGLIAQGLAVANPSKVAGLALVEGLLGPMDDFFWGRWRGADEDGGAKVADALVADTGRGGSRWAVRMRQLLTETTFHRDLRTFAQGGPELVRLISAPTLVLSGAASEFFESAHRLASLIPAAILRVLPEHDHASILAAGAPLVREHLIDWLRVQSAVTAEPEREGAGWPASCL